MNIKRRIWSLPLISAVIFGLGLAVSSYYSSSALDAIQRTGGVDYPVMNQSGVIRGQVAQLSDDFKNAVLEGDKKRLDTIGESAAKISANLKRFGAIPGHAASATKLDGEFKAYYAAALAASRIMLEMDTGDSGAAIASMQSTLGVLTKDLNQTVENGEKQFNADIEKSVKQVRLVLVISILVAIFVILALVAVSYFVVRAIWQQLGGEPEYARRIATAVAAGDLSIQIDMLPGHEESMLGALAEMKDRLSGIVGGIQSAANEIQVASAEIASGNADLSQRTEAQAENVGQAANSMGELSAAVLHNAASAKNATDLANDASRVAVKGGMVVDQVVDTMAAISTSSKKIVDIIGVIDGIAFQTNILALNAAVEAARAGEQGRGFAVVASEVRNLAQRSASAAKEIKGLIDESVNRVSQGSALVEDAGRTMAEIVGSVQRVTILIGEISDSSQNQSRGLENLSRSVNDMDESTQQNAAMTEEASAAAGSLQEQARSLSEAVQVFKLSNTAPQRKAKPAALQLR